MAMPMAKLQMPNGLADHHYGLPVVMIAVQFLRSIGAVFPPTLRLWALLVITALLILVDVFWIDLDNMQVTMVAAIGIVLAGIPHGTLDVEIAASHFGQSGIVGKAKIVGAYVACAALMITLWVAAPEFALALFLVISIIHFGRDWRGHVDPFLAMMVGWALVTLPALAQPQEVAIIFEMLTGNEVGSTIAALVACASVPAVLGSLVFAYWSYTHNDAQSAVDVIACIIAAVFLPPLIAFAVFFCGLHSPRHMAEALRETGSMSSEKKLGIIVAVTALSLGLGVILFTSADPAPIDTGVIRAAFVLISTLTVPHFILEYLTSSERGVSNAGRSV
jgi:beta-carotene 15,15'-dioxygenase